MIGTAALAIWMDLDPAGEADFNAWYPRQHLPERLSVPGFLRGRRYQAVGAAPPYFTLYELADGATLTSAAYVERLNHPTDWTRRVLPRIRHAVRNGTGRIAASERDAVERHLLTVRITPASGRGPTVRTWLGGDAVTTLSALPGVTACALLEQAPGGTSIVRSAGSTVARCSGGRRSSRSASSRAPASRPTSGNSGAHGRGRSRRRPPWASTD